MQTEAKRKDRYDRKQRSKGKTKREKLRRDRRMGIRFPTPELIAAHARANEMSELLISLGSQDDGYEILPSGDFLEWHKRDNDRSLIWSTELSVDALIKKTKGLIHQASREELSVIVIGEERREVSAEEVELLALRSPKAIEFIRLELSDGASLLWSQKSGNPQIDSASSHSEASVIFDADSASTAESALRATGTKRLGAIASRIIQVVVAA